MRPGSELSTSSEGRSSRADAGGEMRGGSADVIVVGAGLSGLTAAREAGAAGRAVVLLEGRDRLGGRTWFRAFPEADRHVELGGAWITRRHQPSIAREAERYGLPVALGRSDGVERRWSLGGNYELGFPFSEDDWYAAERALFEIAAAARRINPVVCRDGQLLADLDISVEELIQQLQVGPNVEAVLRAYSRLFSGAESTDWSALQVVSLIAERANSLFAPYTVPSETFATGTASLVDALIDDSRAEVRLNSRVVRVEQDGDAVTVRTAAGASYEAASVVLALPLNVIDDIEFDPPLSPAKRAVAAARHPGGMRKIWILVENLDTAFVAMTPGPGFVWLASAYSTAAGELLIGCSAPPDAIEVDDGDDIRAAVARAAPNARVVATCAHDWIGDPFSKGTWGVHRPGVLSAHHSELQQPEGRIVMAGADFATQWVGHMEGAIESGLRAGAQAVSLTGPASASRSAGR